MATPLRGRFDNTGILGRSLARVAEQARETPRVQTRRVLSSGLPPVKPTDFANRQIVAKDFRTALNVGESGGSAGVRFTSAGIEGYNSSLDKTIDIGTDGSGTLGLGATQITWDPAGVVAVPGGAIGAGTIDELQLADEAVTNAKIAVDAIQGDVIAAGAITETKVGTGAISTGKLAANAVTAAKIAAGTITATEIASNAITAVKIQAGAVTSAKISVSQLDAISANLGSITAGTVTGATIRSASSGSRVEMNSGGLEVHGSLDTLVQFHSTADGSVDASIAATSGGIAIDGNVNINGNNRPVLNGVGAVGVSGGEWFESYIRTMRANAIVGIGTDIQIHTSAGTNKIGFFGVTPVGRQNVSGSRGGNAALADLLTSLEALGLIVDSTT